MQLIDIKPITTFKNFYKILFLLPSMDARTAPTEFLPKRGCFSPANHDHGRIFRKSIVRLNLNELYIYLNKYLEKFKIFSSMNFCDEFLQNLNELQESEFTDALDFLCLE